MTEELTPPTQRPQFSLGQRLHNEGEFYEAHEAWEEIWRDEANDEWRTFLQGLIQVTSAFHKLFFQRAPGGAARLLERGLAKLEPYPSDYLGVRLGEFRDGSRAWLDTMNLAGEKGALVESLDRRGVPRLERYDPSERAS